MFAPVIVTTAGQTTSGMLMSKPAYRWQPSDCSMAAGGGQLAFGYQHSAATQHWPCYENSIYYHTSPPIGLLCGGTWGRVLIPSLSYPTSSQLRSNLGLLHLILLSTLVVLMPQYSLLLTLFVSIT